MARVTGLGGIFYVVKDPAATRGWYRDMLGIDGEYGPMLRWADEPGEQPYSLVSHFSDDKYIQPGKGGFMINLRVDDCEAMVEQLKAKGIEILGYADEGYGRFAWLLDPDGIKIELWQQMEAP
jgi:catechol 2,3-dioxygenase-like lactoylglutathione lyase family enzyme